MDRARVWGAWERPRREGVSISEEGAAGGGGGQETFPRAVSSSPRASFQRAAPRNAMENGECTRRHTEAGVEWRVFPPACHSAAPLKLPTPSPSRPSPTPPVPPNIRDLLFSASSQSCLATRVKKAVTGGVRGRRGVDARRYACTQVCAARRGDSRWESNVIDVMSLRFGGDLPREAPGGCRSLPDCN